MPGQDIAPAPQRIAAGPRAPCGRGRRRFQASFRRALFRAFWRLGFRQSSFRHIARISRHTAPYAWARSPVCMACYGPLHLSDPGKAIRSTDTSSSPCPLRGRYSSCATWRSRGNRKRPSGSGSRRQAFGRARIPKKRRHHGQPAPSSRNPPVPAGAAPRTRTPQPPTAPHPGFSRECDHPRGDQAFGVYVRPLLWLIRASRLTGGTPVHRIHRRTRIHREKRNGPPDGLAASDGRRAVMLKGLMLLDR